MSSSHLIQRSGARLRGPDVGRLERLASAAGGALLLASGARRLRSASGRWMTMAALPLIYRGLTGRCPAYEWLGISTAARGDTRVALSGDRGVHVLEAVRIQKPIAEVYDRWRRLEGLPRFMSNLESVTETEVDRSHWEAKGATGRTVEWDAEIINEVRGKVIGWRSLPGAGVVSAGSVSFKPVRGGRETQITVHLQYAAPLGRLGAAVAKLLRREPSQMIREDLRHFKQQFEAGEMPRATAETKRRAA